MKVIFIFSVVFIVVVYVNMPTCEKGNVLYMTTSTRDIYQICLPADHKEIGNLTCNPPPLTLTLSLDMHVL
jgi:hypothetical protein